MHFTFLVWLLIYIFNVKRHPINPKTQIPNLEKLLLLFTVFQQQFNLIHKVGFWKLDLCKTRLEQIRVQLKFKQKEELFDGKHDHTPELHITF